MNMKNPAGRNPAQSRVLITGASIGIGLELAREFARHGHPLVLVARSEDRLRQLAGELHDQYQVPAEVFVKDLSTETAASELVQALQQAGLSIDILVNNAGFDVYGQFADTDWAAEAQLLHVNLVTLTWLTKLLVRGMRERGYGRILNLGSTGSFIPAPLNAVYSASKAYVLSFSEAIAEELRGSGVTVTALCPGFTRTEFQQRAGMEGIRVLRLGMMEPGAVARYGYKGLMAGRGVVVPGVINQLLVLGARLGPASLVTRIARYMLSI
jgi:short-subunit dehydrogenase